MHIHFPRKMYYVSEKRDLGLFFLNIMELALSSLIHIKITHKSQIVKRDQLDQMPEQHIQLLAKMESCITYFATYGPEPIIVLCLVASTCSRITKERHMWRPSWCYI